jgi:alpha-L-rhamnosidase
MKFKAIKFWPAIFIVIHFLTAAVPVFGSVQLRYLRSEYRVNPQSIDVARPRLSWVVHSEERGQKQTAYQILVASSETNLNNDIGDLWDSKKIYSDQSVNVVYKGVKLRSRIRCFWKVRIWDKDGVLSHWSPAGFWTMGLLSSGDIKAKWIGLDTSPFNRHPNLHLPPCPYFRKAFDVNRDIQRATVYVSALGLFELYLNGHRVGRDHFTPGWTNYRKRVYYLTYGVTELIRHGPNVVGAILANGWYAGYVGFAPKHRPFMNLRAHYGEIPALLVQLEITYQNGSTVIITTDESWKSATGPITESDILMGETYDARLEMPGWSLASFDDHGWKPVQLLDVHVGTMNAYPAGPVRKIREIQPIKITEPRKGTYVFNMGQNFAGHVRLKVRGNSGSRVVLRFAEMLHSDGTIMTENLRRARATDTYILSGKSSIEIWEPRFTYHGFQYVEMTGYPGKPDIETVTGIVMHSDLAPSGYFTSNHPLVNKLYENIVWTQRSNFFDIPTDCPQRDERLGWAGDAQNFVRSATYNMDVAAFFSKWLVSLEDDQRPSGAFPDYAPLPFLQFEPSPGWMDAGIILPYTLYRVYSDIGVIERHYKAMKKFMNYLVSTSQSYLRSPLYHSWGDWLSLGNETPQDLIATAFFAYDAGLMAEMATAISRPDDAQEYKQLYENIKRAFLKAFVSQNGRISGDTQTGYALAINMGLLSQDLSRKAGERLVELIRQRNWHLSTGFLGLKHLLPALTKQNYTDVAYQLLTNRSYPSWGYSIENGATTIWERWDSYTKINGFKNPEMNSFNHYSFGSVGEWMFAQIAGIDMLEPGFKLAIIRPRLGGGLMHVRASYHSVHGWIAVEWEIKNGQFYLKCTIPANTRASVYIPAADLETIYEGDQSALKAEEVHFDQLENGRAVFNIGSGSYLFRSRLPRSYQKRAISRSGSGFYRAEN